MKRTKLLSILLLGLCWLTSAGAWALDKKGDFYQIGTVQDLQDFAALVNAGDVGANAVLTADIDASGVTYTPIGKGNNRFCGTLDGQGHTVKLNINTTDSYYGLCGVVTGGAIIANVTVEGDINGKSYLGGIAGGSNGTGCIAILNCVNRANVNASGANAAGIIGVNMGSSAYFCIFNCVNAGKITGKESGAISGWADNNSRITGCVDIAGADNFLRGSAVQNDCFSPFTQDEINKGTVNYNKFKPSDLTDGTLLKKLGDNFVQGEKYPVPVKAGEEMFKTYNIADATDWVNFARNVNAGMAWLKAVMTDDITLQEDAPNAAENDKCRFYGTFDGQGHKLTVNFNINGSCAAPFGYLSGTVRNLWVSGNITGGDKFIGSVAGRAYKGAVIERCVSDVHITAQRSGDGTHGGIVGVCNSITIKDCGFMGEMEGNSNASAGILGWAEGDAKTTSIKNCFMIADIMLDNTNSKTITRNEGNCVIENCFCLYPFGDVNSGCEYLDDEEDITSGKLCYMLNGKQDEIVWKQTLGTDKCPLPFGDSKQVYATGTNCDGTVADDVTYTNSPLEKTPHDFVDGYCTFCGEMDGDFLPKEDGFMLIGTGDEMAWFAEYVNTGHNSANAKLTDDIDLSDAYMAPIGTQEFPYTGTFDGQRHTLSNLVIDNGEESCTGLFGAVGGATIQNLTLDETCYISGGAFTGLVGCATAKGTLTLKNLGNAGEVYSSAQNAAAIFGCNKDSNVELIMTGCWSTGPVTGDRECGALSGWIGSGAKVSSCWSISDLTGGDNLVRTPGAGPENCFGTQPKAPQMEYEDLESGRLCYMLNGDQTNIIWYQNLGTDEQPVPYADGHKQVYATSVNCDLTVSENSGFTNSHIDYVIDHDYVDGFCSNCGYEDPEAGFLPVIENPDYSKAGGWQDTETAISIVSNVAEHYNHTFNSFQTIHGLKPGVYKLQVQGFFRAGGYKDDIYASGELDETVAEDLRNSYYYGASGNINVAARFMDIMEGAQENKMSTSQEVVVEATGLNIPDGTNTAQRYFEKGLYHNEPLYVIATGDSLTIGARAGYLNKGQWACFDTWRLSYMGNDLNAYKLVKNQVPAMAEDIDEEYMGEMALINKYESGLKAMTAAKTIDEIIAAAEAVSLLPEQIKASKRAYEQYETEMTKLADILSENDGFSGELRDQLEQYLLEYAPADETEGVHPYGSYLYIMEARNVPYEELTSEVERINDLLKRAEQQGLSSGADITSLIVNADMSKSDFEGWETELTRTGDSYNFNSGTGFTDIFPVAETWNTAFNVSQEVGTDLPDGIYELGAYALYRPGGNGTFGSDFLIPTQIYMNDYYRPVKNIYTDIISYSDALNGVNCRYDASDDDSAPHNGEQTQSQDYEVDGEGYIPEGEYAASFAFNGGRYHQTLFAIVEGGKINLGIRNTGNPWYNNGLAMWGGFTLKFHDRDMDAETEMFNAYETRLDEDYEFFRNEDIHRFYSLKHYDTITSLINKGRKSKDADERYEILRQLHAEFLELDKSIDIYDQLYKASEDLYDIAINNLYIDTDMLNDISALQQEVYDALLNGDYTDAEAQAKLNELKNHELLNTVYVCGDLTTEDGDQTYGEMCFAYPLKKMGKGNVYVGTFEAQDRSNRSGDNWRAGIYLRKGTDLILRAADDNHYFVTPGVTEFSVTDEGGHDFQMIGGTWELTLDMDNMTTSFKPVDEPVWNNQVYMVGTIKDANWANSERHPMQHVGDGVYTGIVNLTRGTATRNTETGQYYCELTIFAARSSEEAVMYSTKTDRSWSAGRFGSSTDKLPIQLGETLDSLVCGKDRKWLIAEPGMYFVEFDLCNQTARIEALTNEGDGSEASPYIIATNADFRSMRDRMKDDVTTYFRLENDFDMFQMGWYPLNTTNVGNSYDGGYAKFINLDGNNHIITNFKPAANELYNSFFGVLAGEVRNLGFANAEVTSAGEGAGVLASVIGSTEYSGTTVLESCYFAGDVNGYGYLGGIAGAAEGNVQISNCYANVNVNGTGSAQGGIVGSVRGSLSITSTYAAGEVTGANAGNIVAAKQTAKQSQTMYYDGTNQSTLCTTVPTWSSEWHSNGTIGNGFPILKWQVARGDHEIYCGFGDSATAIEGVDAAASGISTGSIYDLQGRKVSRKAKSGLYIMDGKKVVLK